LRAKVTKDEEAGDDADEGDVVSSRFGSAFAAAASVKILERAERIRARHPARSRW
jgi:hypothetical protein